ncbi:hypothetical protein RclHR1_00980009 [Rhizophagus clarus]|uniref:Uncharacterized protein n=1 Tax=Rhizophagus clarus TaxID=94130 RepID=A0A2Z6SJ72_9GLOM|nr:hypothetical protein RclHR1_00980009 [Rhizophagus clarus]GES81155.1 hypothetical protein GLOIN_2v1809499 [Rhizophagus clarus]
MTSVGVIHIISKLLNPIPQYVLGCLPAIAIIGASPKEKLSEKLIWVLRCLGCPFTGLLYSCTIGAKGIYLCIYWLSSQHFRIQTDEEQNKEQKDGVEQQEDEGQDDDKLQYRPIGIHTMPVMDQQNIMVHINRCTTRASVLERCSSLVSIYYIAVGVIAAISRTTGQFSCEDWPYISLLLSWTIPAVFKRAFSGTLVVKDPSIEFNQIQITINQETGSKSHKVATVTLVAFVAIVYPWITVFLAFYTPPVGYYCRSKFLTVFCSVWSLNSLMAYISHLFKEKEIEGRLWLHVWFSICGFILAVLLFVLALFTNNTEWWGLFNDPNCSTSCPI